MRFSKLLPYFFIAAFAAINLFSGSGCANIVPPSGGPRDSLPPLPLSASPKDSALGVTAQKITINFDEFVDLKNANENILISPYPVRQPQTESKLRSVTVRLKDSLLPNTTYVIDFGNSIADINEGNVLKNFRYVFSTGNVIDTNELRGRIVIAETGKTDSTFFALLYRKQEDSTVAKEKPVYVTRVDKDGFFKFYNLPAGTFYVYALLDADGDKRYNQPTEAFAFADSAVVINPFTKSVELYAYTAELPKPRRTPAETEKPGAAKRLTYSMNLESNAQDLLDSFKLSYQKPLKFVDTTHISLFKDSTTPVSDIRIQYDTVNKKIILFTKWQEGSNYRIILNKEYASDTTGVKPLKNDTINFRVKSLKEYGSVRLRFKNLDLSKHPVMLLYTGEQLTGNYPLTGTEWLRQLYKPGEYEVRFLFDTNKNGIWDAGNYFVKPRLQPERVQNQGIKITIKPNWDNESTIDLGTKQ
jgi:Bacterial Ig-like domain